MVDVTGLRWTEAGRAALEGREVARPDAGARGWRALTSFGRSR